MARGEKTPAAEPVAMKDAQTEAATQIFEVARADMQAELDQMRNEIQAVREESEAAGALKAIGANLGFNELLQALTLVRIKTAKSYRAGGMTWVKFCDSVGIPQRTADRMIEEIGPVVEKFSANLADLSGYPLSKIRLLGRSFSANLADFDEGCIIYGDERVPLDDREGVQALIEKIEAEKAEAQKDVEAKDRWISEKEATIQAKERQLVDLRAKLTGRAKKRGCTEEEIAFLAAMEMQRTQFDEFMDTVNPAEAMTEYSDPSRVTPRMRAALIANLHNMRMQILAAYDSAIDLHGDPAMNPEIMEDFAQFQEGKF